jgi:hypothetical protein
LEVAPGVDTDGRDVGAARSPRAGGVDAHATASAARVASDKSLERRAIVTRMKTTGRPVL